MSADLDLKEKKRGEALSCCFLLLLQSVLTYKQLRLGPEVSNCLFWNKE